MRTFECDGVSYAVVPATELYYSQKKAKMYGDCEGCAFQDEECGAVKEFIGCGEHEGMDIAIPNTEEAIAEYTVRRMER